MDSIEDQSRTYPLKQPRGHRAPVPRWRLDFPQNITHVYTLYVGVQSHDGAGELAAGVEEIIAGLLCGDRVGSPVVDSFRVTDGYDVVGSKVWVAYWTEAETFENTLQKLKLHDIWQGLGNNKGRIGLWCERFVTPIERLETNYARLDHKPGLARIPGTCQPGHNISAYWGAGRDRIPASAHDLFEEPDDTAPPSPAPAGFGQWLTGTNYENMCHIRSGQWWAQCDSEEREAYENDLQVTLMEGMQYLWKHPQETGTIGLRFVQNLDKHGEPINETAGAGFHRNWAHLERWSSKHPSHLAIFNGAMRHAKRFGENRKLMTWHEVSILKAGEARVEYINCDPCTGVMRWVKLDVRDLSMEMDVVS